MPERGKLVCITDRLALRVPLLNVSKLLRIDHYLSRQARAAHNLGFPVLERYYSVSWLSFRLWRMEAEISAAVQQTPAQAPAKAVLNQRSAAGENAVENTDVY